MKYKLKLLSGEDIRVINEAPKNFKHLTKKIHELYEDTMESGAMFSYQVDDEKIPLSSQEDYQAMRELDEKNKVTARKIFIESFCDSKMSSKRAKKEKREKSLIKDKEKEMEMSVRRNTVEICSEGENDSDDDGDHEERLYGRHDGIKENENTNKDEDEDDDDDDDDEGGVNLSEFNSSKISSKPLNSVKVNEKSGRQGPPEDRTSFTNSTIRPSMSTLLKKKDNKADDSDDEDKSSSKDSSGDNTSETDSEDDSTKELNNQKKSKASQGLKQSQIQDSGQAKLEEVCMNLFTTKMLPCIITAFDAKFDGLKDFIRDTVKSEIKATYHKSTEKQLKSLQSVPNDLQACSSGITRLEKRLTKEFSKIKEEVTGLMQKLQNQHPMDSQINTTRDSSSDSPKGKRKSSTSNSSSSPEKGRKKPQKKPDQPKARNYSPEPPKKTHKITLVQEGETCPKVLNANAKSIYKQVIVRNTGKQKWPKKCCLRNCTGVKGKDTPLPSLESGQESTVMLILEGTNAVGEFQSGWTMIDLSMDQSSQQKPRKPDFVLSFIVPDPQKGKKQGFCSSVSPPKKKEPKKWEPSVAWKKESSKYEDRLRDCASEERNQIAKKVGRIMAIFVRADEDEVIDFIKENPQMSVETIIERMQLTF